MRNGGARYGGASLQGPGLEDGDLQRVEVVEPALVEAFKHPLTHRLPGRCTGSSAPMSGGPGTGSWWISLKILDEV